MGIKERRERERQQVRVLIMQAVNKIVAEQGWLALTIRKVAKEIEYSPPIIYEHFDSKETLLAELAKEAFTKVLELVKKDIKGIDDPTEALCQLARTYYHFSIKNKGYAKAIFGLDGIPRGTYHEIASWFELADMTKAILADAINISDIDDPKLEDAIYSLRWLIRGSISAAVVRIHMDEKDIPFNDDERLVDLMAHSVRVLVEGLKAVN